MHNFNVCSLPVWLAVLATICPIVLGQPSLPVMQQIPIPNQKNTYIHNVMDRRIFSSDGKTMAVYNYSEKIALLVDVKTSAITATLKGHSEGICGMAFSPDEKMLVTMGRCPDCTARLWDASTGKRMAVFRTRKWRKGLLARVSTWFDPCAWDGCPEVVASFSSDTRTILTTTDNTDPFTKVWDTTSGKLLLSLSHNNSTFGIDIWEAVLSSDGSIVITFEKLADQKFQISKWDVKTGRLRNSVPANRDNITVFQKDYSPYIH